MPDELSGIKLLEKRIKELEEGLVQTQLEKYLE